MKESFTSRIKAAVKEELASRPIDDPSYLWWMNTFLEVLWLEQDERSASERMLLAVSKSMKNVA